MKGFIVALVSALAVCAAIAIIVMGLPGGAEGAVNYVDGPWSVNQSTTLRDGTWQVNGSMTVTGCTLTLQNATLIIVSVNSNGELSVSFDAALAARWSTLRGQPSEDSYFNLYGDARLSNTTVEGFYYIYQSGGLLEAINCTFRDANTHIRSYSSIRVLGCTFINAHYAYIQWSGSDTERLSLDIEESVFIDERGYSSYGIRIEGQYVRADTRGVIRGCRFTGLAYAVYIRNFASGSMQVVGNSALDCSQGLYVYAISKAFSIHDNVWTVRYNGPGESIVEDNSVSRLTIWNETVSGGTSGIAVTNLDIVLVLEGVKVTGSLFGVVFSSGMGLVEVRNSTVHATRYDFYVQDSGSILLYNTTHSYRGYIDPDYNGGAVIEESRTIHIGGVTWQSGTGMVTGWTDLVNETGTVLASFTNGKPSVVDVPLWRVLRGGTTFASSVRGMVTDRGVRFYSLPVPLRDSGDICFTIIDDSLPWARVTSPMPGERFKDPAFKVEGLCDDLGAGIFRVRVRFGDEAWRNVPYFNTGVWSVTVAGVPDDTADLVVRVEDIAGNVNETRLEAITVDTTAPTIVLLGPGAPVNRSPATLIALTEPHARAYVNMVEVPVADNGVLVASVELREGENGVTVYVVDLVGHEAIATLDLVLDTEPPVLRVDSPADGAWCGSENVGVVGLVSEDVMLTINDDEYAQEEGSFIRSLYIDGEDLTLVVVTAADAAGNVASESRLVHLDTDVPRLQISRPAEGSFLTLSRTIVQGTVTDDAPFRVTVGGKEAEVLGDRWSCEVALQEGTNSFEVVATDAAGNEAVTVHRLVLDTVPPQAVVRLVADGQMVDPSLGTVDSRARDVGLEVSLIEACTVKMSVAGPSSLPAGLSRLNLSLVEGFNDLRIELWDRAGNRAEPIWFAVLVDTVAPPLELERSAQVRTRDADFVVRGFTEAGCQVTVAGVAVGLLGDASFSTTVHLEEGPNVIEVSSVDRAGNIATKNLMIELESVRVGGSGWEGTWRGLALGLTVGMLATLGTLAWWMRRRPAAPAAAQGPTYATPEATSPERPEGEPRVAEPETGEGVQYPHAGVVRRRGR